ncbi:hypothetical protein [Enterobacter hormaechei]|uniref:Uncharacterized protein n=1 Tax=Enterobacter hormaechei TaxID=158836 RepID=A0A6G6GXW9_9ENTR|nr:hypothetical protein [Enterobacter hormaechei]MCU2473029.1 hypothetical protein [Enterobacter hormaechei subsp. xiangfangensis]DAZ67622.1 MAG TPA: hypothetical protein [Caudoviricetes sp.]ELC6426825.1 hypothetical protein [Enterobacter hormaechei]KAB2505867.1 hypothetical protein F9C29_23890 [Enterobacter hormaechei]KLQ26527.1 hypothetical protein ABF71_21035 [Enterobacter hormaechei subsp. steigerwaltii]
MSNKTGGPAFPQSGVCTPEINSWDSEDFGGRGLTVRDYFAAKALQAIADPCHSPELFANRAYEIADAMLRAREAS